MNKINILNKIIFFYFLFILFSFCFINLNKSYVFAQNQPINYLAGVGEFEIYGIDIPVYRLSSAIKIFLKNDLNEISNILAPPLGWDISGFTNNSTSRYIVMIDRKITPSSDDKGSLKIELSKPANSYFYSPSLYYRHYLRLNTTTFSTNTDFLMKSISNFTRIYYPQKGDELEIKFKIKTQINDNSYIEFNVKSVPISGTSINLFSTTVPLVASDSFQQFSYNILTNNMHDNEQIDRLEYSFRIRSYNPTSSINLKIWLDDFEVYAKRGSQYITLPQPRQTSLKFWENHQISRDFIKHYIYNVKMARGEVYQSYLLLKSIDPSFKYGFYINPMTLHTYNTYRTISTSSIIFYRRNRDTSEISFMFDNFYVFDPSPPTPTTSHYRIHINAKYPDYMMINTTSGTPPNRYLNISYARDPGHNPIIYIHPSPKVEDFYSKMFFKIYKEFFGLSKFQPDFYLIDNYKHIYEISGVSRLYNNYSQRVFYRSNFKINNFRKVLANLGGFTGTINPNRTETNIYLSSKKINGFQDEIFYLNNVTRNSYTPYATSLLHNSINEILKRSDLDAILLQISYPTNLTLCTSSSSLINSITSLMYVINNPNIYFHVYPVYFENSSDNQLDPCYTNSMYLPLGNFRNTITNILEIIRATTTDGGHLLVREYERGKVIFNTSHTNTFNYLLSSSTEQYSGIYFDQNGNYYDLSQQSFNIQIPPLNGVILYIPSNNTGTSETQSGY